MKVYESKEELLTAIQTSFAKYQAEFTTIPNDAKDQRLEGVDKTPAENLAYQLGWTYLLLSWEKREAQGELVQTPKEGYKWNQLGELYRSFYQTYGTFSLEEQQVQLASNVAEICAWIEQLSDEVLFEPEQRQWATTSAKWPLYKWIHINTVAPFTTFRTKIRKWKKLYTNQLATDSQSN